jgi:response regulator RpfG family c-di-GMP phosphodiesterase
MFTRRTTILVVDDERGPRESLRIILKPSYQVLIADTGAEALEILRTSDVDLVTIDLSMPGIKGDELMRIVRREFPATEVIIITGWGTVESASEAVRLGVADYLQKPFDVVQVTAAVTRALSRQRNRQRVVDFLDAVGAAVGREREVQTVLRDLAQSPAMQQQLKATIDAAPTGDENEGQLQVLGMLEVLSETIEAKDIFMIGHARRTAYYAGLLADRLCLSAQQREHVRISAFIHDVGKVGVPELLLAKPGPLDDQERDVIRAHPEVGARLVEPLAIASEVNAAVRYHHERWDGTGYPDGLARDDIPLAARIVQLADVYDAMTSDRPYRRAKPRQEALAEIRRCAGTQFDPDLAKEFLAILESRTSDVELDVLADVIASATAPNSASAVPSVRIGGAQT